MHLNIVIFVKTDPISNNCAVQKKTMTYCMYLAPGSYCFTIVKFNTYLCFYVAANALYVVHLDTGL